MKTRIVAIATLFIALVLIPGCGRDEPDPASSDADAPPRVVSLTPSTTEILFAIGAGDLVVGVSTACDQPPQVKDIRKVGDLADADMETLLALRPDLVVSTPLMIPELEERMRRRGMDVYIAPQDTLEDVLESIEEIGRLTGREENAQALVEDLRDRIEAVRARAEAVPREDRPTVYIEIGYGPIYTVGRNNFLHEMVTIAGGINMTGDIEQPFAQIASEVVVTRDPDVILLGYMTLIEEAEKGVYGRIGWSRIKAVRNDRIIADIHPDLMFRPGPRLIDGLEMIHERLYPGAPGE